MGAPTRQIPGVGPRDLHTDTLPSAAVEIQGSSLAAEEATSLITTKWDARALTEEIKRAIDRIGNLPEMIAAAYDGRVWTFLGYPSWDAYCSAELDTERITIPREGRQEVVASLRESGLSLRAISSATGTSVGTVHSDLAGVQNRTRDPETGVDTPMPVTGIDGKTYKRPAEVLASAPRPPRRNPFPDAYRSALRGVERAVGRFDGLHGDDRFARHQPDLAVNSVLLEQLSSDLARLADRLAGGEQ